MIDPQKIQPGTRMPTVFLNGKSPDVYVLGGDAAQQRLRDAALPVAREGVSAA